MNALWAAIIESKIAGDEQAANVVLEFNLLLQARNYMIGTAVDAWEVWTISMVILDSGAGQKIIRKKFFMTTWTPLIRTVKIGCLGSASNSPVVVKEFVSVHLRIGQLPEKVEF